MIKTKGRILPGDMLKTIYSIFWLANAFSGDRDSINLKISPAIVWYTALEENPKAQVCRNMRECIHAVNPEKLTRW